ncbi:hypothetical protein AU467_28875 [Mesorhizobium loti]|uniref:Uncharacterized protein n=1 Tax=Rhizobium loti TaxID=381 RepID=A0A117N2T3_RHILI|nr:hypothetical protein AU467_28875 [Mesorhizobium loti]
MSSRCRPASGPWTTRHSLAVSESDLVSLVPEQLARKRAPRLGLAIYSPPIPINPALICII